MLRSQQDEELTPTIDPGSDGTIAAKDEVKITVTDVCTFVTGILLQ